MAQNASPKVELFGDRFKPLTYEKIPEQKRLTDRILSGGRTSMGGPFSALLRGPNWAIWRSNWAPHPFPDVAATG